jgi:LPLT family lysophospholipid transporter-like MFS transporter
VATVLSLWVADSGVRYEKHSIHPMALVWRFHRENLILWRDPMGGLSMTVTTLLWGVGATLQLMVLRWANEALGLSLAQAAYLQGVTALGVIAGAMLASRWISLNQAATLLPVGILIGVLIPSMLFDRVGHAGCGVADHCRHLGWIFCGADERPASASRLPVNDSGSLHRRTGF